jgi:hypothetical protein
MELCDSNNDYFGKSHKKQKLENKIRDGIISPPKSVEKTTPEKGNIYFNVPSSSSDNVYYKVSISVKNDKIKYSCNCRNNTENICNHIRSAIIKTILDVLDTEKDFDETNALISQLQDFDIGNKKMKVDNSSDSNTSKFNTYQIPSNPHYLLERSNMEMFHEMQ